MTLVYQKNTWLICWPVHVGLLLIKLCSARVIVSGTAQVYEEHANMHWLCIGPHAAYTDALPLPQSATRTNAGIPGRPQPACMGRSISTVNSTRTSSGHGTARAAPSTAPGQICCHKLQCFHDRLHVRYTFSRIHQSAQLSEMPGSFRSAALLAATCGALLWLSHASREWVLLQPA